MKEIKYSTRFKKDIKKYAHSNEKLEHLFHIVSLLENEIEIPKKYLPHRLIGEYKGCMECHIENDFLLIWQDPLHDVIWFIYEVLVPRADRLVRTGLRQ